MKSIKHSVTLIGSMCCQFHNFISFNGHIVIIIATPTLLSCNYHATARLLDLQTLGAPFSDDKSAIILYIALVY